MKYLVGIALLLSLPLSASAAQRDVLLSLEPATPAPGTLARVTATIVGGDTGANTFSWLINDEPAGGGIGAHTWQVIAPEVGERTGVRVLVNGEERSNELIIRGARVTIEWEALATRPPFYSGRSLLGGQGTMRASAIPEFLDPDGTRVPASAIRYTWRIDGSLLGSQSGYGQQSVLVRPVFYDNPFVLSVLAETRSGQRAEESVLVRPVGPEVVVYETAPLSGLLDNQAIVSDFKFSNQEVAVIAYPLHASNVETLTYQWTLNGSKIEVAAGDPRAAVFKKTGSGTGAYSVGIDVRSTSSFLDRITSSFLLHF